MSRIAAPAFNNLERVLPRRLFETGAYLRPGVYIFRSMDWELGGEVQLTGLVSVHHPLAPAPYLTPCR